jgi:HK97 family phage major capsid protein
MKAIQRAKEWKGDMPEITAILEAGISNIMDGQKAATGAGTTTDATFASPLIFYQVMVDQFIQLLRPRTIIGRIPGLRLVPFNIQMPATTTGSSVGWVGENAPKPVSAMAFTTVTLRWAKAAGIVILTQELVRFSNPSAEAVVRNDLVAAMAQFLDRQFVDPAVAAVPNVSPASILNGVTPTTATGTNEAALRADIKVMMQAFLATNLQLTGGVWIMTQQQALALSLMINALGQPSFPTITGEGGTMVGYPVVASENLPATGGSPADGYPLIFALASEIMLADDGQTVIDASNQASVQMDSAPDSPPSAASPYVSLWQMNYVGLRAERWINWQKRRTNCVSFIQNAKYG